MLEFGTENTEINQYSNLAPFVISIEDNPDNQLCVVIALPKPINSKPNYADIRINDILSNAVQVVANEKQIYEIRFETYIIYQCRNESYTSYDPDEVIIGKYLVVYKKSPLLEYYDKVTIDIDYDNEKRNRRHYGIISENHIIDVISNTPPIITKLNSDLPRYVPGRDTPLPDCFILS